MQPKKPIKTEDSDSPIPSSTAKSMSRLAALAPQDTITDVSGSDRCGPDITDWLVKLFNGVINHQAIQDAKDNWSKGTSQGRISAAITFGLAFQTGGQLGNA